MITTIRLDGKTNYLIDKEGNILDRYNPDNKNQKLVLTFEDSVLEVDASQIHKNYGGQVVVQYNSDRFIIDDGYQNILIKAGYIIYKDYDVDRENNGVRGIDTRNYISGLIKSNLPKISRIFNPDDTIIESTLFYSPTNDSTLIIENSDNQDYRYTINIDTIDTFVSKNHKRRDNELAFYPFEKHMDKYGTMYISIFAEKIRETDQNKYAIPDELVSSLMHELGMDFHYLSVPIKKQILYWKNL